MRKLFFIFSISLSALSASADPTLTISSEGWATSLEVQCEGGGCESISIQRKWGWDEYGKIGPFKTADVKTFLTQQKYKKKFATPEVHTDLTFDESAGSLNIFLPVIKTLAYMVALTMDAHELATNPNKKMQKVVERIESMLEGQDGPQKLEISHYAFDRLNEQFEKALKSSAGTCAGSFR